MRIRLAPKKHQPIPDAFLERAHQLGLISWSLDLNGMPTQDPVAPGTLSLWLSSKPIRSLLTERASVWSAIDKPEYEEIIPGMWIYPFIEEHRGRRTGYTVLIGFGEAILESEYLQDSGSGSSLQLSALRHQFNERMGTTQSYAKNTFLLLEWALGDLLKGRKHDETIEGFSAQLGNAFETITALHDLGMNMNSIRDTGGYILRAIEHVAESLEYQWAA